MIRIMVVVGRVQFDAALVEARLHNRATTVVALMRAIPDNLSIADKPGEFEVLVELDWFRAGHRVIDFSHA